MKGKTPLQIFHEMKYQSMEWKLPKEPSPKKVKASRSAVKVMLAVFWDAEGNILAYYFSPVPGWGSYSQWKYDGICQWFLNQETPLNTNILGRKL